MPRKRLSEVEGWPARRHYLREWRKFRGFTQEQLAELVDVTPSNISLIENGKHGYTQGILEDLALALSTDTASLLCRDSRDPEGIWAIWDLIPPADRARAIDILKALARVRN